MNFLLGQIEKENEEDFDLTYSVFNHRFYVRFISVYGMEKFFRENGITKMLSDAGYNDINFDANTVTINL